jgi:outer membrane protein
MKKILFVSAICLGTIAMQAQTEKETWLIGGNINLNTAKNNTTVLIAPNVGYFFAKNFAAGALIEFKNSKIINTTSNTFSLGPFARYYVDLKEEKFKPFLHVGFGFDNSKVKVGNNPASNETASSLLLALGGAYFINKNIAFETIIGYTRNKPENFEATNGLAFRIGFQIHLSRRDVGK